MASDPPPSDPRHSADHRSANRISPLRAGIVLIGFLVAATVLVAVGTRAPVSGLPSSAVTTTTARAGGTTTTVPPTTTTTTSTTYPHGPLAGADVVTRGDVTYYAHPAGRCASPWLRFGTVVSITNPANGATVSCVVDDREADTARSIDLATSTFAEIAPLSQGVVYAVLHW